MVEDRHANPALLLRLVLLPGSLLHIVSHGHFSVLAEQHRQTVAFPQPAMSLYSLKVPL